jgi:hypothetical protein
VLGYVFGVIMAFSAVVALAFGLFNVTAAVNGPPSQIAPPPGPRKDGVCWHTHNPYDSHVTVGNRTDWLRRNPSRLILAEQLR